MLRLTKGDKWKAKQSDLAQIASQFGVTENGFLADLFELYATRGRALIGPMKVSAVVKDHMKTTTPAMDFKTSHKLVSRQFNVLSSLKKAKFFIRLCDADPLYAVESTISLLKDFIKKAQPATCQACKFLGNCDFGQQFSSTSTQWHEKHRHAEQLALRGAPSIDYTKKFNPECPEPPYAQTIPMAAKLIGMLIRLTQPINATIMAAQLRKEGKDKAARCLELMAGIPKAKTTTDLETPDPGGKMPPSILEDKVTELGTKNSEDFDPTFTGKLMFQGIKDMVNTITAKHLSLWELNRVFEREIAVENNQKLLTSEAPDEDIEVTTTDRTEDLMKALPHELASDGDELYKKLASHDLQIRKDMKPQKKANLVYIIFDVSGSMTSSINPNQYALVCRANLGTAMCLSLIKKAMDERSVVFFRFFASVPNRMRMAETEDQMIDLSRMVGLGDSNGGGTDIMAALLAGAKDIQDAKVKGIKKAELVLISDGLSAIDEDALRKGLKGVRMHTLDVSGDKHCSSTNAELGKLKRVSATFYAIDPNKLDLSNISASVTNKEDSKEKKEADAKAKAEGKDE